MRPLRSLSSLCVLLGVLLGLPAGAAADEPSSDALPLEVQQLLREAGQAADAMALAGIDPLRQALARDRRLLETYEPKDEEERRLLERLRATVEERELLIGRPAPAPEAAGGGEGEGAEDDEAPPEASSYTLGALQEAHRLTRWLQGRTLPGEGGCGILVADSSFTYPPEPPAPPPTPASPPATMDAPPDGPPPPAPGDGEPAGGAGDEPGSEQPADAAGGGEGSGGEGSEAEAGGPVAGDDEAAAAPEAAPVEAPPAAPTELAPWALWVRDEVGGSLLGKRIQTAPCLTVPALLEAHRTPLRAFAGETTFGGDVQRFALAVQEDVFAYNAPFVRLRALQRTERVEAFQQEKPPGGLTDESTVEAKARRAQTFEQRLADLRAAQGVVRAALGEMVTGLDLWKFKAAEIEERKKALAERRAAAPPPQETEGEEGGEPAPEDEAGPPAGAPAESVDLEQRLLQAQETLVTLEMRLLYLTARRAQVRRDLLASLIDHVEAEHAAAEEVRKRFQKALDDAQRGRLLDRLTSWKRRLETFQQRLAARAESAPESTSARRYRAIAGVLAVGERVREAVTLARQLNQRVAPPQQPGATAAPPAPTPPAATGDGPGAAEPVDDEAARRALELDRFRDPQDAYWDEAYMDAIAEKLDRFPRPMVTAHYEEVVRRIESWRRNLAQLPPLEDLEQAFQTSLEEARQTIGALGGRDVVVTTLRLDSMLESHREDFSEALTTIRQDAASLRERLQRAVRLRERLTQQGPRSFGIRVSSGISGHDLMQALEETQSKVEEVGAWLEVGEGDGERETARDFLERRWPQVLLLVGLLVAAVLLGRWGRRRLDRWIERRAARIPAVRWTGASVAEERASEKEQRQREAAVGRAREDAMLRQTEDAGAASKADKDRDEDADRKASKADAPEDEEGTTSSTEGEPKGAKRPSDAKEPPTPEDLAARRDAGVPVSTDADEAPRPERRERS